MPTTFIDVCVIVAGMLALSVCIGIYTAAFELWNESRAPELGYEILPSEPVEILPGGWARVDAKFDAETGLPIEPAWVSVFDAEGNYQKRVLCELRKKEEDKRTWPQRLKHWLGKKRGSEH